MSNARMEPIQHHALCLAAGGYWNLADALELVALYKEDPTVSAIAHPFSSKACIGRAEESYVETCSECDGYGHVECDMGHDHECPTCNGEGGTSAGELSWQTLDGEEFDPGQVINRGGMMMLVDARLLISQYERLIDRLQGKAVGA